MTDGFYSYKMDLFAAGCVWFEVMALFPLFPGQNEMKKKNCLDYAVVILNLN